MHDRLADPVTVVADAVGVREVLRDAGFDGVEVQLPTAVGLDVHDGVHVQAPRIDTLLEHIALRGDFGDAVMELLADPTALAVQLALEEDERVPPDV